MKVFIIYCDYEGDCPTAITFNKTKAEEYAKIRQKETGYKFWIKTVTVTDKINEI